MGLFRHILFPVDFSARCRAVSGAVLGMAQHSGARLTMLHVVDLPPGAYADWYAFSAMVDVDVIRKHERGLLDSFLTQEAAGVELSRTLVDGSPVPAVVKFADNHGVDLIMLPTHGYGRFRSLLLGSVTAGILHDAHCPVWTSAHSEEGGSPSGAHYRQLLCATDLSAATPKLLDWAQNCASSFQAQLHVIHVLPAVADPVHSTSAAHFKQQMVDDARQRYHDLLQRAGLEAPPCEMLESAPGETVGSIVAREATARQADLVLAGRGAIQGTFGRLRTHVSDIIRLSPCPVLSI